MTTRRGLFGLLAGALFMRLLPKAPPDLIAAEPITTHRLVGAGVQSWRLVMNEAGHITGLERTTDPADTFGVTHGMRDPLYIANERLVDVDRPPEEIREAWRVTAAEFEIMPAAPSSAPLLRVEQVTS